MEEKDLFRKLNEESENFVPDVYNKIMLEASAQGLFEERTVSAEEYFDGETVAVGGVNGKAIAITSLAAVAAVCLAIALPITLSGKYDGGETTLPPTMEVADIDFGNDYKIGAVTTARLAESFLKDSSLTPASTRAVTFGDFNEFGTYFTALDCFLGQELVCEAITPPETFQKSVTITGRRVSGDLINYSLYYNEYKIISQSYAAGDPVDYYLEGEFYIGGARVVTLVGERTLSSDAADAEETALKLYAYPDIKDKTTYAKMQLQSEEIDGTIVKSYSYEIVKQDGKVSEAVAYKPDGGELVINLKDGENNKGIFNITGESDDGKGYKGSFDFGKERGEFTVKMTDNGLEYEIEENDILGYRNNGDGTYSVSTYDKNVTLPETLIIPSTHNGYPVVGICERAFEGCSVKNVIIGEGITEIGNYAFYYAALEDVSFPSTLKTIGDNAFYNCAGLKAIDLPKNLNQIGNGAFSYCAKITETVIPENVISIGWQSFVGCRELVSVALPKTLSYIGEGAFRGCHKLERLSVADGNAVYHSVDNCVILTDSKELVVGCKTSVIPDDGSVTSIVGAFEDMALTSIDIPSTIKRIYNAFSYNPLTSVVLPEGVEEIGSAFYRCSMLVEVILPDSLINISSETFAYCNSLQSINIPANVHNIWDGAFKGCASLSEITVDENNFIYHSAGNCLIDTENKTVVAGCKDSVIPDDGSVEIIGAYAFSDIPVEGSLVIPDSVWNLGDYAFKGCSAQEIILPANLRIIGDYAFNNMSDIKTIAIPEGVTTLGEGVFIDCYQLESVSLPSTLTSVGNRCFEGCSALKSAVFADGITKLYSEMFKNCTSLESITIPASVTAIEFQSLYGCGALTEINYGGTKEDWTALQKDGETWDWNAGDYVVKCTNGEIRKGENI